MHPHFNEMEADGRTLKPMLNIGLWGFGPRNHDEFVRKNRDLERKLKELGGMKWLYAHTYYDENEFWEQFDRKWYDGLRAKYGAESLPTVYEKVKVDIEKEKAAVRENMSLLERLVRIWPFGGFYGIWKAIQSRSYVAARKSVWKEYGRS
jgi:hypothetical protein